MCGNLCEDCHSTYKREIQDMPILDQSSYVFLTAYRYYCFNSKREQEIFCEPIDGLYEIYKRITDRLANFLIILSLNTSCKGAATIANKMGIKISGDSIIQLLMKKVKIVPNMYPSIIRIDDRADKKGYTYRAIIVDESTHNSIELLDGRDRINLNDWLKRNTQIKVVTRDKVNSYAKVFQNNYLM